MLYISSKKNPLIKHVASLKQKKNREEYGEYLVEGFKMINEAIQKGMDIVEIFVLQGEVDRLEKSDASIYETTQEVLEFLSDTETPQGALAVLKVPEKSEIQLFDVSVLLDSIRDPGNLGTIIRTCAALGIKSLYLLDCCDAYSPKVVRSTMSGIYSMNIFELDEGMAFETFKDIPFVIADMDGENMYDFLPPSRFCLVIGNESNGVRESLRKASSHTVRIPMSENIESLNAAVSFGILAYELTVGKTGKLC